MCNSALDYLTLAPMGAKVPPELMVLEARHHHRLPLKRTRQQLLIPGKSLNPSNLCLSCLLPALHHAFKLKNCPITTCLPGCLHALSSHSALRNAARTRCRPGSPDVAEAANPALNMKCDYSFHAGLHAAEISNEMSGLKSRPCSMLLAHCSATHPELGVVQQRGMQEQAADEEAAGAPPAQVHAS